MRNTGDDHSWPCKSAADEVETARAVGDGRPADRLLPSNPQSSGGSCLLGHRRGRTGAAGPSGCFGVGSVASSRSVTPSGRALVGRPDAEEAV